MLRIHLQVDPHITVEITTPPSGITMTAEPHGLMARMWWVSGTLAEEDAGFLHQVAAGADWVYVTRELGERRQRILRGLVTAFEHIDGCVYVTALQLPEGEHGTLAATSQPGLRAQG